MPSDQKIDDATLDTALAEQFLKLPKVVQDAIISANIQKEMRSLAEKHSLHIDQWGKLENEVMLTILGFQEPSELTENLVSEVGVNQEMANALAVDINTIVFEPIRQELERSLESPEAQEKELSPEEEARKQLLAEAQQEESPAPSTTQTTPSTENVAKPALAGTPPPPPLTQKAVRAPLSSAYTARQPSSERKVVEGDPYREPPK